MQQRTSVLLTAAFALATGCSKGGDATEQVVVERVPGGQAASGQAMSGQAMRVKTPDGDAVVELDGEGGEARIRIQDGDGEATFRTGGAVPESFPLPILPGATVVSALSSKNGDKAAFQVALTVKGDAKEAAAFYEAALKKKGLLVERHDVKSRGTALVALRGTSGSAEAVVSVTATGDGAGVNLSWQEQ